MTRTRSAAPNRIDDVRHAPSWLDRLAALTLVLAGVAGAIIVLSWVVGTNRSPIGTGSAMPRMAEEHFVALLKSGHRTGEPDAPVVVVVYNDYRCGFCVRLHRTLQVLTSRYPQHLAVVWKHFGEAKSALGRQYLVPLGAECAAEQNVFEQYHAAAFDAGTILDYADAAQQVASDIGVPDTVLFRECVESRRYSSRVRHQYDEARQMGVEVTPTLFVNGIRIMGSLPLDSLDALIVSEFPRRRPSMALRSDP
jgi:predicted DsbA family dithiol-disulfide isomerase